MIYYTTIQQPRIQTIEKVVYVYLPAESWWTRAKKWLSSRLHGKA